MASYDSSKRSERVKLQLRDKFGRWIQMGKKAKWYSKTGHGMKTGTIVGTQGKFAIMMPALENATHRPEPYLVPLASLGMMNPKANLDKRDKETKDAEKDYQAELENKFNTGDPLSQARNEMADKGARGEFDSDAAEFNRDGSDPTPAERDKKSGTNESLEEFREALEALALGDNAGSLEVGHGDDKITVSIDEVQSPTANPSRAREIIYSDSNGTELGRTRIFPESEENTSDTILSDVDDYVSEDNNDFKLDMDNDGVPDSQDTNIEAPGATIGKSKDGEIESVEITDEEKAKETVGRLPEGSERDAIQDELDKTPEAEAPKEEEAPKPKEEEAPKPKSDDEQALEKRRGNIADILNNKETGAQVEVLNPQGKPLGVATKLENGKYSLVESGGKKQKTLTSDELAKRSLPTPQFKKPLLRNLDENGDPKPNNGEGEGKSRTGPQTIVTDPNQNDGENEVPELVDTPEVPEAKELDEPKGNLRLNDQKTGYKTAMEPRKLTDEELEEVLYDSTQSLQNKRTYVQELGRRIKLRESRDLDNDDLNIDMFMSSSYWNDNISHAKTKDGQLVQIGDTFLLQTGYKLDELKSQDEGEPHRSNERDLVQVVVAGMTSNGGLRVVPAQTHITYVDDHKAYDGASYSLAKEKTYDLLSLVDKQLFGVRVEPGRLWDLDGKNRALQHNLLNTQTTGRQAGHRGSHDPDELIARSTSRKKASGYAADGTEVNVDDEIRFRSTSKALARDTKQKPVEYIGQVVGINKAGQNFRVAVAYADSGKPYLDRNGNQVYVGVSDKQTVGIDSQYDAPLKNLDSTKYNFPPEELENKNLTRDAAGKVISKRQADYAAKNDESASSYQGHKDDSLQYEPGSDIVTSSQDPISEVLQDYMDDGGGEEDTAADLPDAEYDDDYVEAESESDAGAGAGTEEEDGDNAEPETEVDAPEAETDAPAPAPAFEGKEVPRPARADEIEAGGNPVLDFVELSPDDSGKFVDAIESSKEGNKFGYSVYVYPEEEYKDKKLFVTPDGSAGFAVAPDGDIVSVFNNKNVKDHGGSVVPSILATAVEQGGTKLDAFDTVLPKLYAKEGFKPVGRSKWNPEYAPEDWNTNGEYDKYNNGEPDVVFMEYDPDRIGSDYDPSEGEYDSPEASTPEADVVPEAPREKKEKAKPVEEEKPERVETSEPMYQGPAPAKPRKSATDADNGQKEGKAGRVQLPAGPAQEESERKRRLGTRDFAYEGVDPYENWMSRFAGNLRQKTFKNNEARSRYITENAPVGFQVATNDGGYALKVSADRWELKEGAGNRVWRATSPERVRKYLNKAGDWSNDTPELERPQYKSPTKSAYIKNLASSPQEKTAKELRDSQPGTQVTLRDKGDEVTLTRSPENGGTWSEEGGNTAPKSDSELAEQVNNGNAEPSGSSNPMALFTTPNTVVYQGRKMFRQDPDNADQVRVTEMYTPERIAEANQTNQDNWDAGSNEVVETGNSPVHNTMSAEDFAAEYSANVSSFRTDGPVLNPKNIDLNSDENSTGAVPDANADTALNNADSLPDGTTVAWGAPNGEEVTARKINGAWEPITNDPKAMKSLNESKKDGLRGMLLDPNVGAFEEEDLGDSDLDDYLTIEQPTKKIVPVNSDIHAGNKEMFDQDELSPEDIQNLMSQGVGQDVDFSGATLPEIQGYLNDIAGGNVQIFGVEAGTFNAIPVDAGDVGSLHNALEGVAQSMSKYPHLPTPSSIVVDNNAPFDAYHNVGASGEYSLGVSPANANKNHEYDVANSDELIDENNMPWMYSRGNRGTMNHEMGHALASRDTPEGSTQGDQDKAFAQPALAKFLGMSVENLSKMSVADIRAALARRGGYSTYQTDGWDLEGGGSEMNWPELFAEAVADVDLNAMDATDLSKFLYALVIRRSHKAYKGGGRGVPEQDVIDAMIDQAVKDSGVSQKG